MRRIARHLFTLCSAVSLVLCVTAGVFWARSYGTFEGVFREDYDERPGVWGRRGFELSSMHGAAHLFWSRVVVTGPPEVVEARRRLYHGGRWYTKRRTPEKRDADSQAWHRPGYEYRPLSPSAQNPNHAFGDGMVRVPFWCLFLLLALAPAWRLQQFRRARACGRTGLCVKCGYDLRASPQRCPECGTVGVLKENP